MYKLTSAGTVRAAKIVDARSDPEMSVIYLLEEKGPQELIEIAGELNTTDNVAERILDRLIKKGLVEDTMSEYEGGPIERVAGRLIKFTKRGR